ncbi:MAG: hypothetical protein J5858_01800 [Lentisphaeria bacterium]|nr:hypothetical protein [Lentisphaeria bacterium]
MPTSAVQDQIWEFFYEYAQCIVSQILLDGSIKTLTSSSEMKEPVMTLISILYPKEDYGTEIFARLRFIAERAFATDKPGDHDCYSPLDTPQSFRRMLGLHLWEKDDMDRKLRRCREDYAAKIRRNLRQVEFEQSRYDSWELRYLEYERSYHQILNRIGESVRPATPAIYSPRSPWELRTQLKDLMQTRAGTAPAISQKCTWKYSCKLRNVVIQQMRKTSLAKSKEQSQIRK